MIVTCGNCGEPYENTLTTGSVSHACRGWLPGTTATGPVPSMSQPIMQDDIIHGSCGNCGGPVVTSRVWMGVQRQVPRCNDCGATAKSNYGPAIPMNPSRTEDAPDFSKGRRTDGS